MKTSRKVLIVSGICVLVLGAVAAIAGPVIYRDFISAPAAEAPSVGNDGAGQEAASTELDPSTLAGSWIVGDGSEAGYRVNEVLNGTPVTVTGRTSDVSGTFTIGDSGLTLEAAELTVDVASIATDSGNRDAYFRDQAMRVGEFPTAVFTLTEAVTLDAAPGANEIVQTAAAGTLTLAGVSRPVTFDVQVKSDGTSAEIAGSIPITFADFGVEAPNLGFVAVEPSGQVEFQLTAARGA
ncbi:MULTISPECIES: YceI family protein [unclassified Leucobacter]|uniref:YceI family protein n=1 Tax=unclassified Leucobacter TaxID=2621730 RepID=UPI00165DF3D3|nr:MULTISPECIES: YceI family protein [unclassified Leucobacter]MBC9928487.1 YceI family protein [Leucobacter sp. cx-169]